MKRPRAFRSFAHALMLFRDYAMKRPVCSRPPFRMWLDLSTACNLRCRICPQSLRKLPPRHMAFDLFAKIIDEVRDYVFDVNLAVTGESLLNPRLPEMIRCAKRRGVITRLHTNATMLTGELSREIIEAGLSFISFSLDGFDKAGYESVRTGATWEETVRNIREFLAVKDRLGSRTPYAVVKTIVNPDDYRRDRAAAFEALFEGMPVDRFRINPMHNFGGKMTEVPFSRAARTVCYVAWYGLTVLADGAIVPCCMDFWNDYPLGDANHERIIDAWNGARMVALRRALIGGRGDEVALCRGCYFTYAQKRLRKQHLKDAFAFLKEYRTITR
ncbi:MAG: radical SAM/SPASM domain-containing protein [Chlamydiota bacterium]